MCPPCDFHVSNVVEAVLEKGFVAAAARAAAAARGMGEDSAAVLRSAMWTFRSSVSMKEYLLLEGMDGGGDGASGQKGTALRS